MLDLTNEVARLQGHLFLSTFHQKSYSLLALNTEHNGVVQRRVACTCSCERARARLPLIEGVCFAESWRKLPSQTTFKKIWTNGVIADNAASTINGPRMLKWYSSHPSKIFICPIMHIMPIHISRICEDSFIRKKHMTQK